MKSEIIYFLIWHIAYIYIFYNNFELIMFVINIICIFIKHLHCNLAHNNNLFSYTGGAFGLVAC